MFVLSCTCWRVMLHSMGNLHRLTLADNMSLTPSVLCCGAAAQSAGNRKQWSLRSAVLEVSNDHLSAGSEPCSY